MIFIRLFISLLVLLSLLLAQGFSSNNKAEKLHKFLVKQNSVLIGHEQEIVKTAEKFKLDYRLYVAIAGCESTFGKRYIRSTHNLTGIGNGYTKYRSIYENIYETHRLIAEKNYYKKYRKTGKIEDLVYVYKGVPPFNRYIRTIKHIMNEIE